MEGPPAEEERDPPAWPLTGPREEAEEGQVAYPPRQFILAVDAASSDVSNSEEEE